MDPIADSTALARVEPTPPPVRHVRALPGPRGWPLIGSLPAMGGDRLGFMLANRATHGDVVGYRVAGRQFVQLGHPDQIDSILVGHNKQLVKDEITTSLDLLLGKGLLTNEGEPWRYQRKLLAPSFQPRHLAAYADAMVRETRKVMDAVPAGVHDVHDVMTRVTLGIVLATLFDANADGDSTVHGVGEIMNLYVKEFERMHFSAARAWPAWVPWGPIARTRRIAVRLDAIFRELVQRRRERPPGDDMLSRMLVARDDEGKGMSDAQLRDEAVTMFMAGHETTAVALSYALHLLSLHPEVAARVRTEIASVVGDRAPTGADVHKLAYTEAVFREAMRLYPPAWVIGREVVQPFVLDGTQLLPGTQVLMPQWVVHRDPRWFPEPDRFWPERWEGGLAKKLPTFAYFPFGGGARVCIGLHFAMMEGILVLATILPRFALEPAPGFTLELTPAVTLRPKRGLPLGLSPVAAG